MSYGRFKKATICLALICVFALPVAATFTPPVSAQGYHRRYDRRARYYYRDQWRRQHAYHPRVRHYGHPPRYHRRYY
jgi:hypothetical protein